MQKRILDSETLIEVMSHYTSRADFAKMDSAAYHKCKKLGILDKYLPRALKSFNETECLQIASKYEFPWELGKANNCVYQMLQRHGLLNKAFANKRTRAYDEEAFVSIAKTYDYASDFRKDHPAEYQALLKHNKALFQSIFTKKKHRVLTYEVCRLAASKYNCRADFGKFSPHEYAKSCNKGWINDFAKEYNYLSYRESVLKSRISQGTSMCNEAIVSIAKKYKTPKDFIKHDSAAYSVAQKRGLLESFTWLNRQPQHWEDVTYVYEFPQFKVAYVGRTGRFTRRDYGHRHNVTDPVYMFAERNSLPVPQAVVVARGMPLKDGQASECRFIEQYKNNGWTLLNRIKGGGAGNIGYTTSKKNALAIAKKFTSLKDLREAHKNIVAVLYSRGWIQDCPWLSKIRAPKVTRGYWNVFENVKAAAQQFDSVESFKAHAWGAYDGAARNGWLTELFSA